MFRKPELHFGSSECDLRLADSLEKQGTHHCLLTDTLFKVPDYIRATDY